MTAPTITGLTGSVTFGENTVNAAPQIVDSDVTVTDAEGNFDGGALTVSGHFGGDSISIRDQGTGAGQIGFSGGTITYGGTAIGAATGGSAGAEFVVTFNAGATTAAVEALIENLTYANSNNVNPATSRTLKIVLTDGAGEGNFVVQTGAGNPFNGVDIGFDSAPAFGDLDGDGDLDMVSGESNGTFLYFKNTGTASAPVYVQQTGADNPLNGFDVGAGSVPALVDIDGDGDLDVVSTENDGVVNYFKNTGTTLGPVFAEQTGVNSPFGMNPTNFTKAAFADVDGDGDKDMLLGTHTGSLLYYKNTGTATAPVFAQQGGANNPFNGIDTGSYTAPALGDVDGDGDLDLVVGDQLGTLSYFENTGSTTAPVFVARIGAVNPFNGIDVGSGSTPTLADIDNDGDLDLVSGALNGTFTVALNATARVKVNVFTENDAPVAEDASYTISQGDLVSDQVSATDVDGTVANYVLDSGPAKGSIDFYDDGSFLYRADDAFDGLDAGETEEVTFTYHAVDNSGASSATQTVTITVEGIDDLPELGGLAASITFAENTVNAGPRLLDASVTIVDVDDTDFGGGSLTVRGLLAEDIVSINDQGTGSGMIGFSGGIVTFEGPVVGVATGGNGAPFVVTFNDSATAAIVETVVENLTYANTSNTPTASRTLEIALADASGGVKPILDAQTGAANPFNGIKHGGWNPVALGDLDGDGDLDLIAGSNNSGLHSYVNTGSETAPVFSVQSGAANLFDGATTGNYSSPALVDIDGDGDLDAVVGSTDGKLAYFENTGTAASAAFTARTGAANPFDGIDVGSTSAPAFADMDGDGDLDMIVGNSVGNRTHLDYFENTVSGAASVFTERTGAENPFNEVTTSRASMTTPAIGDFDGDGDLDLALGTEFDGVEYFQNAGSASAAHFVQLPGMASPFYGVVYGALGPAAGEVYTQRALPAFVDLDADGDLDAVVGHSNGIAYAENIGHTIAVNVTAENDAPVATDLSAVIDEDGYVSFEAVASDAEGIIADYVIDSQPAKGRATAINEEAGEIVYFDFSTNGDFDDLGDGETETVSFTYHAVDDDGAASATQTVTVTVLGINDLAELAGVADSATFAESTVNATPQLIDASVTLTDPEGNFDGGFLTVNGLLAEDVVSINHQGAGAGQIGFSGGVVTYGGVAIGTAAGGGGTDLTVTFNHHATTAAVEALVENLTYANSSDAPTASRTLNIAVADASGGLAPSLEARTGADNPFAGIKDSAWNAPTFGDIDGDGDLDMVVGDTYGALHTYENTGSATAPAFTLRTGATDPFAGINVGNTSSPALVDLDGDGDLDLTVSEGSAGAISYFENTGTAADPAFTARTGAANPFDGLDVSKGTALGAPGGGSLTFGDLDGDGDLDAIAGARGDFAYLENTGSADAPQFTVSPTNLAPLSELTTISGMGTPTLGDVDGDGDLDLIVGTQFQGIVYFQNTGTTTAPIFLEAPYNPFFNVIGGPEGGGEPGMAVRDAFLVPVLVDIDGDGDLDGVVGGASDSGDTTGNWDTLHFAENTGKGSAITINVTAENDAPVAVDGAAATTEDSAVNGAATATDVDGTVAGYALVSDVAKGDLTFNSDGTWSFDPDGAFDDLDTGESEQVTFTWRATDNDGAQSAVKTVTITVNGIDAANVAPVASDGSASTDEDTAIAGSVVTSDIDGAVIGHTLVSTVAKGSLTFLEDGSWSFDPDGAFEALGDGESEQVSFTYRAIDNDGAQSAAKTVTITVNGITDDGGGSSGSTGGGSTGGGGNAAPVITSATAFTVAENTTAVATIKATDADGDAPVFSIAGGADALLFQIDATTGALSFKATPDFEEPGDAGGDNVYEVTVSASDGSASDAETLTITVTDEDGVSIKGSKKKDSVSDGKTVSGQAMATGEEDAITGKGKNDTLHGAGGNDRIDGGKGNDKLYGDEGDDWLVGGKDNDKLTGGLGEDSFVFNMKLADNVDKVKDFAAGIDTIVLDDKVFKKLSPGPLSVEEFLVGKKAKDGDDHILYNAKNGQLLYDQDGKGGKDALLFAKIGKGLDLDAGDFLVI